MTTKPIKKKVSKNRVSLSDYVHTFTYDCTKGFYLDTHTIDEYQNIFTTFRMKDALFIQQMIERGKEAGDKVRTELEGLTSSQLNWKSAPESWSIGQCLDHLIVSDCLY